MTDGDTYGQLDGQTSLTDHTETALYCDQSSARLYFTASTSAAGKELYVTTGSTMTSVTLVKDINAGAGSGVCKLASMGVGLSSPRLFLMADSGTGTGCELWSTDGTSTGTALVKDMSTGSTASDCQLYDTFGSAVMLNCVVNGVAGLWRSNGTSAGTVNTGFSSTPYSAGGSAVFNGTFIFMAGTGGTDVVAWDGTAFTTLTSAAVNVANKPVTSLAFPALNKCGSAVFYPCNRASVSDGTELCKTDGTLSGTVVVKSLTSGATGGVQTTSTIMCLQSPGTLFFVGSDGTGNALWKSDGTASGTVQFSSLSLGQPSIISAQAVANVQSIANFRR